MSRGTFSFYVDRGGTFTDVVYKDPSGTFHAQKLLSTRGSLYEDASCYAIKRAILSSTCQDWDGPGDPCWDGVGPIPAHLIDRVRMGTTVATNALLERKGARVLLVTNVGFKDALKIATQARPRLFDLNIQKPSSLFSHVLEVDARTTHDGDTAVPLDEKRTADALTAFREAHPDVRSVAVVLMHSYRYPSHESAIAALCREAGFEHVSASHEVSPLVKFVGRGDTAVVDAYLSPTLRRYIDGVQSNLGADVPLSFMMSSGTLAAANRFRGKDAILSGPAGGVVAAATTASMYGGFRKLVLFDMGGTSTDVSHVDLDGEGYERAYDTAVAGVRVRCPMLRIHTVAAGGGSICTFRDGRCRVGPDSAGSSPGPACYRNDGPLTVTDCNAFLGRLQPECFPRVFGPMHDAALDAEASENAIRVVASKAGMEPVTCAEGFLRIAVDNMANAVKKISVARGYDVTKGYALTSFGGAGGQHACLVADALGIEAVYLHKWSGVLSAYGMGLAEIGCTREQTLDLLFERSSDSANNSETLTKLASVLDSLVVAAEEEVRIQVSESEANVLGSTKLTAKRSVTIRYDGTDVAYPVPFIEGADGGRTMVDRFEEEYQMRFGFVLPGKRVVFDTAVAECTASNADVDSAATSSTAVAEHMSEQERAARISQARVGVFRVYFPGLGWVDDTPFIRWDVLGRGQKPQGMRFDALSSGSNTQPVDATAFGGIAGPCVLVDDHGTIVVEIGWAAFADSEGVTLQRIAPRGSLHASDAGGLSMKSPPNPIYVEVFNNLFMNIAEQMGYALQNASHSVNMKERLDFSCAIFDKDGNLVANAPHMPVHLGSMGASVRKVMQSNLDMAAGDVYVLNDPYNGGTHLPDVTVVTPVFSDESWGKSSDEAPSVIFYVGSRGHHADIGGITPASMPSNSKHIDEEGVLINNFKLVSGGMFDEDGLRRILTTARYPARDPDANVADIRAQVAANAKGIRELKKMCVQYSLPIVQKYMGHVQDNAELAVRAALSKLRSGSFCYELDSGKAVCVRVDVDAARKSCVVDFSGTSSEDDGNFNAPLAVTRAATLYVFRTLVADEIPMNEGCMLPIELLVPDACMLNPTYPRAVVAGNVEVSQVVTDTLYGAMGIMGASQGTMNNVTFGSAVSGRQYYETVAGGTGAGPTWPGADGVQSHMTNSRLTDPEVLELRFPVSIERFSLRDRGPPGPCDGRGKFDGGVGVERVYKFHAPMKLILLANRRRVPPYGMAGGHCGAAGEQYILRGNGTRDEFGACDETDVSPGDVFYLATPCGGGYGEPSSSGTPQRGEGGVEETTTFSRMASDFDPERHADD